ncbi:RHS repeat domain-containing protein [Bergeyella zoohelcum]|nr:RHS repeat-associated core domain-containing protein [Bergeyella zoohelcum]
MFEVGLIHMNGRLYDPLLRRFLNADEHIQDPYNTQNYNKYGYVYNNPLMYNDPDGEIAFLAPIFAWVAANAVAIITAAGISAALAGIIYTIDASINNYWTLGGFAKAVFGGALTGAVAGALGQVFSASTFWATVGNGALAGAGGGGMNALINGQNFLEGLVKGAVIGGAIAAVSYAINFYSKGYNKMKNITEDIEIQGYEQNGDFFKSNEELKQYVNKEIGNVENIESKLKTDLQLAVVIIYLVQIILFQIIF